MILFNRAVERNNNNPDDLIKVAFNEILGTIYSEKTNQEVFDNLIEQMAKYAMEKLDIQEKDLNWQIVEEWHYKEQYSLADWYLEFSEIKKNYFKIYNYRE